MLTDFRNVHSLPTQELLLSRRAGRKARPLPLLRPLVALHHRQLEGPFPVEIQ